MKIFIRDYSIFECGFDSIYWYFNKFSLHFFKIGIIFVLFDLELMYLLLVINNNDYIYLLVWFILNFIIITLFIEFYFNNLNWVLFWISVICITNFELVGLSKFLIKNLNIFTIQYRKILMTFIFKIWFIFFLCQIIKLLKLFKYS